MAAKIIAIYDIVWTYGNEQHEPQGIITITSQNQRKPNSPPSQTQKSTATSSISPSQYPQLLGEEMIKNSEIQDIDYHTYCLIGEFEKLIEQGEMKFKEVQEALQRVGTKLPVAAEVMAKMRIFATELLSPSRRDLDEDRNNSGEGDLMDEPDFIDDDGNNSKEEPDNEETIYQAVLKYSNISAKFTCEPTDSTNRAFKNFNEANEFTILKDTIIPKSSSSAQLTSMNIAKDSNDFLFLKFIIFKSTGIGSDDSPIIGFAKRRPLNIPSVTDAEIDGILEEEYAVTLQEDADKQTRMGVSDDDQWEEFKVMEENIEKSKVELEGKGKAKGKGKDTGGSWSQAGDDTFGLSSEDLLENVDGDVFSDGEQEEEKEDQGKEILVPLVHRTKDRFLLDEDDLNEDEFSDFGIEDSQEEIRGNEEVQNESNEKEDDTK